MKNNNNNNINIILKTWTCKAKTQLHKANEGQDLGWYVVDDSRLLVAKISMTTKIYSWQCLQEEAWMSDGDNYIFANFARI